MEGWWSGLGTSVSRFDAREGGKGQKQPPRVETQDGGLVVGTEDLHLAEVLAA